MNTTILQTLLLVVILISIGYSIYNTEKFKNKKISFL